MTNNLNRRDFLKVSTVAGAGLLISFYLSGCQGNSPPAPTSTSINPPEPTGDPTASINTDVVLEPNTFVKVDYSGKVTITVNKVEIGQGIRTALAMILAEELDVDWADVLVETAYADGKFGDQDTSGSGSIVEAYTIFRRAGATARALLVNAAAETWGVKPDSCQTESGEVIHHATNQRFSYGELVEKAASMPVPMSRDVALKDPDDFNLVGTSINVYDSPAMVSGSATYGIDVKVPNMLYATVLQCPIFGGRVSAYDASMALSIEGVRNVEMLDGKLFVVAENSWAAMQGKKALEVSFSEGSFSSQSSETIEKPLEESASSGIEDSQNMLQAVYKMPFLAHSTMEPMNCTVDFRGDSCEIWAPTQYPMSAKRAAVRLTGLPEKAVRVHIPLVGGGFGRRINVDYVEQAVLLSQTLDAPVKLIWTRDEDIQHDFYHPLSYSLASVNLDAPTLPAIQTFEVTSGVPTGAWRSASNLTPAFVRECFLDEMAVALGRDPLELRLELEPTQLHEVLEKAASEAGWGESLPDGWGRGIACHSTWSSTPVAEVVEVSVSESGELQVHRVVCAIDCGLVINPDSVIAQMEGGIVFGLSAALKKEITIKDGRVQQNNFHDYPMMRLDEVPEIQVHIIPGGDRPHGVGEMAVPPIAPALLNAVYNATGVRIRHLPVRPEDLSAV